MSEKDIGLCMCIGSKLFYSMSHLIEIEEWPYKVLKTAGYCQRVGVWDQYNPNLNSTMNEDFNADKEIKVGQTIKLKTGPLKGYSGIA